MKYLSAIMGSALIMFLTAFSREKNIIAGRLQAIYSASDTIPVRDSVNFYDSEIKTKQKSYKKELIGTWKVVSMRRQQKAELEILQNVSIVFGADTSFTGKAPCNNMGGVYTLKGTSVKFSGVYTTKMACDRLEAETAFMELLQNRVSAYSVSGNTLKLMDGSSNIVFECERAIM
jgi:heat shock protein HslJ